MTEPDLSTVLDAFFADPGDRFAELGPALDAFNLKLLEDHKGLEGLLPRPDLTPDHCFVWRTPFDNAPFLILARTEAPTEEGKAGSYSFIQRRIWLMDMPEETGVSWVKERTGAEANEVAPQSDGAVAHIWPLAAEPPVLQDGYRLYVAAGRDALVLDRIAMIRG